MTWVLNKCSFLEVLRNVAFFNAARLKVLTYVVACFLVWFLSFFLELYHLSLFTSYKFVQVENVFLVLVLVIVSRDFSELAFFIARDGKTDDAPLKERNGRLER